MPAIRHDALMLRLLRDLQDVRSALRRVAVNLPLFDIDNENTPAQITSNQNNYAPGNYDVLRLSSSQPVLITGIRNGMKGRRLRVFNVGDHPITFVNQSADSSSENRFKFRTGTSAVIESGDVIVFYYDLTQERWIEGTQVFEYTFSGATTVDELTGTWTDIAWSPELSLLVVVGPSGIYTSPDGETWTVRVSAISSPQAVCWSDDLSLFVCVSSRTDGGSAGDKVQTSPDGINWTARVSAEGADADYWNSVVWADDIGLFVAVGKDGSTSAVMTSPDGINWTVRTSIGSNYTYTKVIWANNLGRLIATNTITAASTTKMMTSTDGIVWAGATLSSANHAFTGGQQIAWSDRSNVGVAVTNFSSAALLATYIYTTTNGTSWTLALTINRNPAYGLQLTRVARSDVLGTFIIFGAAGSGQSSLGEVWTLSEVPVAVPYSMIYVEELGQFIGVATDQIIRTPV